MNSLYMLKLMFYIFFPLMALFMIVIGLRVLITKRPMFISARWFFVFMLLLFLPQMANSIIILFDLPTGSFAWVFLLTPLLYVILIIFSWIQMKGYMVIGINNESFRTALLMALEKQGIEYEETLSSIKLPSHQAELQVAIQSWIGSGQLKLKKSRDQSILKNTVNEMVDYYKNNEVKINYVTTVFYTISGVFIMIMVIGMIYLFEVEMGSIF